MCEREGISFLNAVQRRPAGEAGAGPGAGGPGGPGGPAGPAGPGTSPRRLRFRTPKANSNIGCFTYLLSDSCKKVPHGCPTKVSLHHGPGQGMIATAGKCPSIEHCIALYFVLLASTECEIMSTRVYWSLLVTTMSAPLLLVENKSALLDLVPATCLKRFVAELQC